MTREEAKWNLIHALRWNDIPKKEALNMAIKALEQEPCEDCISRQAVLDIVNNPLNIRLGEIIKKLPSVTPQPKNGEEAIRDAFRNGTPLPEGHGRIVDIGQIDKDKIEKDNPIICLTDRDGVYLEVVSLDYLYRLPTIIEADKEGEHE